MEKFLVPPPPALAQRGYTVTAFQVLDVPGDITGDAAVLANQGFVVLGTSGATSARPTANLKAGALHVDTTLGKTVVYDGIANWRDPTTGSVV
jgi:hypothetical protein